MGAKRIGFESRHCMLLMRWAKLQSRAVPELQFLFHIPNEGRRSFAAASVLKAMGLRRGVWDYFLPVSRQSRHGMWIEMKALKEKLTPEQEVWGVAMRAQGYETKVCYSWAEAAAEILAYLGRTDLARDLRGNAAG